MSIRKSAWALLLLLLLHSQSASAAERWALLIGVNDYAFDGIPDLRGCENDVTLMESLLTEQYEFPKENIRRLFSAEATKAGIVSAIEEQLVRKPGADDIVVLYYSGHGVQIADRNGDEEDGFDEALCPADMGPNETQTEFVNYLLDDELDQLLSQIPTDNVTVIFDCSHSGTATKNLFSVGMSQSKVVNRDLVLKPQAAQPTDSVPAAPSGLTRDLEDLKHVVITGCRDHEVSQERTWYAPEFGYFRSGVLTKNLTDVLKQSRDNPTYADLMEEVRNKIGADAVQTPQLYGDAERPAFAPRQPASRPYLLVTEVDGDTYTLNGGAIHGVTRASVYAVYPPKTLDFTKPALKQIEITAVGMDSATAKPTAFRPFVVEGMTPPPPSVSATVEPMSRAVEVQHAFPADNLYLKIDAEESQAQKFMTLLNVSNAVRVKDERQADFVVKIAPEFGFVAVKLISVEGQVVSDFRQRTLEKLVEGLRPTVEREVLIKLLTAFRNPSPPFGLEVWVDRQDETYRTGDPLSISFRAEADCRLILLNVDYEGYVTMMFPNKHQPDNRIRGGRIYTNPSSEMPFKIQAQGPDEQDTIHRSGARELVFALATTEPITHPILQITDQSEMLPDLTGAKLGTQLIRIVSGALRGGDSNGERISLPTRAWVTDSLIVVIKP